MGPTDDPTVADAATGDASIDRELPAGTTRYSSGATALHA
jgi:hypothetical protein